MVLASPRSLRRILVEATPLALLGRQVCFQFRPPILGRLGISVIARLAGVALELFPPCVLQMRWERGDLGARQVASQVMRDRGYAMPARGRASAA